jgi:peptidoglycan/LPS O-acetylase OafA/YrhL
MWAIVGMLLWMTYFTRFQSFIPQNIGMAPFCAVLIYCLARYPSYLQQMLGCEFLKLLGEASYSLYLVHILVLQLFFSHSGGAAGYPEWWVLLYQVGAMMVALHVFCFGLLHFVERPARTLLRGVLYPSRSSVVAIRHRLGAAA